MQLPFLISLSLPRFIGGRSNASPLTPLGLAQAAALGARLAKGSGTTTPLFACIHSSTAVRAVGTAAAVAAATGLDPSSIIQSPDLLELDMGAWEGGDRAACYNAETLTAIDADPTGWAPPGGGESQAGVEERMAAYVASSILPSLVPGGPPGVLVGHGLAIKCLLRRILGADPAVFAARNVRLDNTGITEVGLSGNGGWSGAVRRDAWHVLRVNDAAHCEGLGGGADGLGEERVGR